MAETILVIGESGAGKSTGIKTLDPETTFLINCIGKKLPFMGSQRMYIPRDTEKKIGNMVKTVNSNKIVKILEAIDKGLPMVRTIVIDDAQYVMAYEFMDKALTKGYEKYSEMAKHFFQIIETAQKLRDDLTVIFIMHSEEINKNGFSFSKAKTLGKMIDNNVTLEGLFTIVLHAQTRMNEKKLEHFFLTNSDGSTTAKSPDGMFDLEIPNDYQLVLDKIFDYYNASSPKKVA